MIPKYRAWDKDDKVMRIVNEIHFGTGSITCMPLKDHDDMLEMYDPICFEGHYELMQSTEFQDDQGNNIFIGDFTELIVDGEKRIFEVKNKQVIRKVKSHPSFIDEYAKVVLDAVVFVWNGFELFPCVDKAGIIDTSKMRIVGNIFETPELQKLQ